MSPHKTKLYSILTLNTLLLLMIGGLVYLRLNTYLVTKDALETLKSSTEIKVANQADWISFDHLNIDTTQGFIIYPGGLVEPSAYGPLCRDIAESFDRCFILKMPFNLAILNPDKAQEVIEAYPEVRQWTVVAHSLGGPAVVRFIQDHPNLIQNLVFLGSYSDLDISTSSLNVLSLLGSKDGLVDREKYETSKSNLPANTKYQIIEGGNHSQMGDYGLQKNDGLATISKQEQRKIILEQMELLINP